VATTGIATLDFGSATNRNTMDASVDVTGQAGILAGSQAEAWIAGASSSDHSEDEHLIEDLRVRCGIPTAGVGFTIYGFCETPTYGQFTVQWVWN
jgi:hypothetical protein